MYCTICVTASVCTSAHLTLWQVDNAVYTLTLVLRDTQLGRLPGIHDQPPVLPERVLHHQQGTIFSHRVTSVSKCSHSFRESHICIQAILNCTGQLTFNLISTSYLRIQSFLVRRQINSQAQNSVDLQDHDAHEAPARDNSARVIWRAWKEP